MNKETLKKLVKDTACQWLIDKAQKVWIETKEYDNGQKAEEIMIQFKGFLPYRMQKQVSKFLGNFHSGTTQSSYGRTLINEEMEHCAVRMLVSPYKGKHPVTFVATYLVAV